MKNTALITGASGGIGRELAIIHAEKGGDLVLVARNEKKLEKLKSELESSKGVKVMVIKKDLSQPAATEEVYNELKKAGIDIDILINNAGFGGIGKFFERPWEEDKKMINLNILALTSLTRFFLPDFVNRGRGKILNVSSTASLVPGPLQAVYYATKAYVTFFSNALSEELRGTGVTVTNLMPGATQTNFGKISGMDKTSLFNNAADARDVAEAGYKGMLKGKIDVIAGLSFSQQLMLKTTPFLPKKVVLSQIRKMQEIKD